MLSRFETAKRKLRRVGVLTVWALIATPAVRGQVPDGATGAKFHPDSSYTAEALLRSAEGHAREQQWAETVAIYQRVIAEHGGTMARVPKGDPETDPTGESQLWVDARRQCQRRLAALPADALAIYRNRVDAEAERWYRQGADQRDRALLRRVVEEAFCSSWGDDALDLLGDLAFQDGQFAEALSAYRRLVPEPPGLQADLVHPDPSVDRARVAAKILLCREALGVDPPGPADLKAFETAFPNATGPFAGRRGLLAKSVAAALKFDHLTLPVQPDGRWPTFAGASTRTRVVPGTIDVGSLQWKVALANVDLPHANEFGMRRSAPPVTPERLLAYHPIVLGDQVVVCDENRIVSYNLNDRPGSTPGGAEDLKPSWDQKLRSALEPRLARSRQHVPRFTLTASGDRVFARLGPINSASGIPSTLVAIRNNREVEGKRLWERPSTEIDLPRRKAEPPSRPVYEGAPVADGRQVYIALTVAGTMTSNYVACFDAETGATRWVRYLGAASPAIDPNNFGGPGMGFGGPGMGGPVSTDVGGRLLSLDGSTVYYQTNMGALAALDAETGQIRWLATYAHREPGGLSAVRPRELNPAVIHDGLVIIAPDDSPWIYAFEAGSGRLAWKSDRPLPEATHLLGVARGRLIATGDHVWSLDAKTGTILCVWPDGPGLEGYGRGLLAGDQIYWPTRTEVLILDQATGLKSSREPIPLKAFGMNGGNLAVGDGYLIVAGTDTTGAHALAVFCQNRRLIERYREEIARNPEQAGTYIRLARVAEATEQDEVALSALTEAIRRARPLESFDGQPLAEVASAGRYRLLMRLASRAAAAKHWADAAHRFALADKASPIDKDRLAAKLRLAEARAEGGAAGAAVDTLQAVLTEPRLRTLTVEADPGKARTVRADLLVTDRLADLLNAHGRDLYATYDARARDLLARGRRDKDPHLLEEVGRGYPVAEAAPDALLALAELHAGRRPAEAARVYKRLLAHAPTDALRARALWGLAQAYETQGFLVPARDIYARALARYPDVRLDAQGTTTIGGLAAARLVSEPLRLLAGELAEPSVPLPLVRRWDVPLSGTVQPLSAEGTPPSADAGRIFLAEANRLRPIDPSSGRSPWSADLGGEPVWVGYLADRVLAATPTRLMALGLDQGVIEWRYPADDPDPGLAVSNPFAKGVAAPGCDSRTAAPLHGFRIVGNRVFCLRGDRELIALDGDTGLVDWTYAPASGRLNPHFWVGQRRVVLQILGARATTVAILEVARGLGHEYPQDDRESPWGRDPLPLDDDHALLTLNGHTVVSLDLDRGQLDWTCSHPTVLPSSGAPLPLTDAGRLLVLFGGAELVRLDPATGKELWARTLGHDDLADRPGALALGADQTYSVQSDSNRLGGATLTAFALADGAPIWTRHLIGPASGWVLSLTDRYVVAHPGPRQGTDGRLSGLPLVFCRRDTGALVQRLIFPTDISALAVRLAHQGILIASQAGLWALGDPQAVDEVKGLR